ncbi:MAG: hypothetical protein F6K40_02410 [Okeania sp. SIO3I5]|uniref:hypothetical protein n=1 Tax=Okeania sp. SIO3I5 TaxID=2607805 RepID=UPI0013BC4599|nr:hypothetical protein [Okeania sp. SIO3I5]NEQ35220.1 hypothetical protein [Okeania sp. SIO3I5]
MQIVNLGNLPTLTLLILMTTNPELNPKDNESQDNVLEENESKDNVLYLGIPDNLETKNLDIPDVDSYIQNYISDQNLSHENKKHIYKWVKFEQEKTRKNIAEKLLVFFGASLGITYLLVGLASIYPESDKQFIREMIPIIITPQVTLLGVALGFYFKEQG